MEHFYRNPVYDRSFPDPFVLKFCGEYWAYCTGVWGDGRWFGVLRSRNLVDWEELAGAMAPLPDPQPCLWAPEVSYSNGRFYLYYSYGDEATMHLRVATATHPAGPFVDSGRQLTSVPFAIDAHVFVDADGQRYLFYATDFLEHSHIGTGTVRDRLYDPYTLAGQPVPVTLARYDWQVYDPQRPEKGGVRWHTVEGPFVLQRKGRYYQMFSAGNWQNPTYGVSYAMSERIDTPDQWEQAADGTSVLPILQTLPGEVIGPGHNSAVRGPDNRQIFAVYHRWAPDGSARVMAIDPLDWAGERMLIFGPSTATRPGPNPPTFADFFEHDHADGLGERWRCVGGRWSSAGGAALQRAGEGEAEAQIASGGSFVCEVSLRVIEGGDLAASDTPACGLALRGGGAALLRVGLAPGARLLVELGAAAQLIALPPDFAPTSYHLVRLEVDGLRVTLTLDEGLVRWQTTLAAPVDSLALWTRHQAAAFAGLALTTGWEDLFTAEGDPAEQGWQAAGWQVVGGELRSPNRVGALALKGPLPPAYELVVNLRLGSLGQVAQTGHQEDRAEAQGSDVGYGIYPARAADTTGPLVRLARAGAGWALSVAAEAGEQLLALPAGFDPHNYQQLRFRVAHGQISIACERHELGVIAAPVAPTAVGLWAAGTVACELVRVTQL